MLYWKELITSRRKSLGRRTPAEPPASFLKTDVVQLRTGVYELQTACGWWPTTALPRVLRCSTVCLTKIHSFSGSYAYTKYSLYSGGARLVPGRYPGASPPFDSLSFSIKALPYSCVRKSGLRMYYVLCCITLRPPNNNKNFSSFLPLFIHTYTYTYTHTHTSYSPCHQV